MTRVRVLLGAALVATLTSCAGEVSSGGEAISGGQSQSTAASPDNDRSLTADPPATTTPRPHDEDQRVSLGGFASRAQAVAAAEFYEQLWTSYHQGRVTDRLDKLATPSALRIFRDRVRDYRTTGHTVADLTDAKVVEVERDRVFVCMASSSYQRIEARTGAAVNPPSTGYTQYVVRMQRARAPWKVDTINGTENSPCGKASS